MKRPIFAMGFVAIACGCDRGPGPIVWTPQSLSPAQEIRQEKLLGEIHVPLNTGTRDSVDGVSVTEHAELLALADTTGVRGYEQFYKFIVRTEGDVHDSAEMIIVV